VARARIAPQKALLTMQVLVDTPVWFLALRRRAKDLTPLDQMKTAALRELIRAGRAQLVGPVRQGLLSGVRQEKTFRELRDYLRAFDELALEVADYEDARTSLIDADRGA
jgi:hypothetical protein